MKALYFDLSMGAAGDMLTAALLGLVDNPKKSIENINNVLGGRAVLSLSKDKKCGIMGNHVTVIINGRIEDENLHCHEIEHNVDSLHEHSPHIHSHTCIEEIFSFFDELNINEKVKSDCINIFSLIFNAESEVHGEKIENIHLHEVGSIDALADVLAVCMLIDEIKPYAIYSSHVHVGSGTVKCAHGVLPVPAPATEILLRGIPYYSEDIKCELCTPTGAAIVRYFSDKFCVRSEMTVYKTGYGTGTKELGRANVLRVSLCDIDNVGEKICELKCNLDDMTPEALGFAMEKLLELGALDVWLQNIQMKKNRPGIMLCLLCKPDNRDFFVENIFKYTTTLGIREYNCPRYTLKRDFYDKETDFGTVRIKKVSGYGITREKPEYDDVARLARENNLRLDDII